MLSPNSPDASGMRYVQWLTPKKPVCLGLKTYFMNTGVQWYLYRLYENAPLKIISPNFVKVYTHTVEEGFTIDSKEVSTLFCTYPLPRKKRRQKVAEYQNPYLGYRFFVCNYLFLKVMSSPCSKDGWTIASKHMSNPF